MSNPQAPADIAHEAWCDWLREALTANPDLLADRRWRIENLYWIQNEEGKEVLFKLRPVQREYYESMWYCNIVLKSRQHGFSTLILIYALDACFWNENYAAGVIAHTRDDVKKLFRNKIRFPYRKLPGWVRSMNPASQDTTNELVFKSGSSIGVGTSMRSGTLQLLHVSEHGKICAKFPDKAQEIRSGALNTVHPGQILIIESTAEGRRGDFYEYTMEAKRNYDAGKELSKLDFRYFFYPWWRDPKNVIDPRTITITDEHRKYFKELREEHGIKLTPGQKAWWVAKEKVQRDLMYREHPSTPEEAFWASTEGTYFGQEMLRARREGRIMKHIPLVPSIPVDTCWDLGKNDEGAIWLHQYVHFQHRMIGYYENSGRGLGHYWEWLQEWREKHGGSFGRHFMPHDIEVSDLTQEGMETRRDMLEALGMTNIVTVPRVPNAMDGIEASRALLPECYFSEEGCGIGIVHMESYQRRFNERTESYEDIPLHDQASNGADAFRQLAQGWKPEIAYRASKKNRNWRCA